MEFRTPIAIPKSDFLLTHKSPILLLGSCFTENIGNYLRQFQFKAAVNPFGVIYNPISIFNSIKIISENKLYDSNKLNVHNALYFSYDFHGSFSSVDKEETLLMINNSIRNAHTHLHTSEVIVFTLGSAYVYEHKEMGRVVANCHKLPGHVFNKRLLTIEEIVKAYSSITNLFSGKQVIFTVSPVRHWRDGAMENQRSKSILIEAVHQLISLNSNTHYFPAYEIMMDELRDYRFYEEDMLHPNKVAVKYIWKRFGATYFEENTVHINQRIDKINNLLQHRIKHPNTKEQRDFLAFTAKSIETFKRDYPEIETNF
ncbi:MAG TPA: GSCFA domain-containing protein [Chitinophagales bacterium]|nr:GSCFA domain-containing protein [Chitinophagales bacterium]